VLGKKLTISDVSERDRKCLETTCFASYRPRAHTAPYPMGTRCSFPGLKRPGREAYNSPPSSPEVKEWVGLYSHSFNTPSWRGAQLKHRDSFTFLPLLVPTSVLGKNLMIIETSERDWKCLATTCFVLCPCVNSFQVTWSMFVSFWSGSFWSMIGNSGTPSLAHSLSSFESSRLFLLGVCKGHRLKRWQNSNTWGRH